MAPGIFNKLKKFAKNVGKKIVKALPKIIDTGKKVVKAVKPVLGSIPIASNIVNAIDTGLNVADKGYRIGKSLIDEVK